MTPAEVQAARQQALAARPPLRARLARWARGQWRVMVHTWQAAKQVAAAAEEEDE